ncbi:unnamed protein product [Effrenium voratum]|nr:unnamed protein product [Effrenium voratum]|mmetsp:Transcript_126468/g.300333  ORF Transcript_126468/g.300333 Transcript_126468/m.300333 type:complete len:742 (+) Transcript_126468:57-2282(+)
MPRQVEALLLLSQAVAAIAGSWLEDEPALLLIQQTAKLQRTDIAGILGVPAWLQHEVQHLGGAWPEVNTLFRQLEDPESPDAGAPSGSDVWKEDGRWTRVPESHPTGVVSHVPFHDVRWNDVSYISMNVVCLLCTVAYPAVLVAALLGLTVLVSVCLRVEEQYQKTSKTEVDDPQLAVSPTEDLLQPFIDTLPILPKHKLTPTSRIIYSAWATFCCAVPSIMVFGTPVLIMVLARPFPQEVLAALTLLTSAFVYSNTLYMSLFAGFGLCRMKAQANNPASVSEPKSKRSLKPCDVRHWIILPQYKEDVDTIAMCMDSIAQSSVKNICVLLAMEEREAEAEGKAAKLIKDFQGKFTEVKAVYHPKDLPNDPPGKASNVSYAFRQLLQMEKQPEQVVLTVADADSEFGAGYFDSLSQLFAENPDRYHKIWQSPVFHMKNYHRQPSPVVVGTMFTSMQELAGLSDPNAVRFPYSTYSLSLKLAKQVGGWDVEWIAEDYHMGIKCFLMTLGKTTVEPIMSPTVNYVPEKQDDDGNTSWWGTCMARWTQLQRHALGFSDFSYYFMMLPLVFSFSTSSSSHDSDGLRGFWRMLTYGTTLLIRLVNVHVLIGVLSTYGAMEFGLQTLMQVFFGKARSQDLDFLFVHVGLFPRYLMVVTVTCTLAVSVVFFLTYSTLLKPRIDGQPSLPNALHFMKNLLNLTWASPLYFLMMGYAIWRAAILVLTQRSFEYHVAPKPKQQEQEAEVKEE